MKIIGTNHWAKPLLLALALTTGVTAIAQTFEESAAAYNNKDYTTAFSGLKQLAEQGDAAAQFGLGRMYANGRGVPKDKELAYFWWLLSSAQGIDRATTDRNIIEKQLTPTQRASAQATARDWKAKPISVFQPR